MLLTQAAFYIFITIGNIVTASTPECGPRDVIAARRKCEKACLLDGTCRKKNRECVCDGLCGLSCLRKRCPVLTVPLNGNMIVNPVDRTIGAEVSYSCNDGYVISGQTNSICQANKTWSGTEPMCTDSTLEVPCPLLELSDGIIEYRDENDRTIEQPHHGDTRTATCSEGYVLSGISQTICSSGVWQDVIPSCQRVPCPILDLEDGALAYLDQNNRRIYEPYHGDIRVAFCKDGTSLLGTSQTRCLSGSWQDELPSCKVNSCQTSQLEDGMLRYYDSDGTVTSTPRHGDYRIATCNEGYSLEGTSRTQCLEGEWIEELPTCQEIHCSVEIIDNGGVTRGNGDPFTQEASHGDIIRFTCEQGYTLAGEETSHCRAGEWVPQMPTCVEDPCNINDLSSGDWNIMYDYPEGRDGSTEVMKPPGTTARFTCNEIGYVAAGQNTRTCRQGGWDGQNPSCKRSRCQTLRLEDGKLRYYDSDDTRTFIPRHGDYRIATCRDGYSLEGTSRTQCLEGEWIEGLPTCQETHCSVETIHNGGVTRGNGDPFTQEASHGVMIRFTCEQGYTLAGEETSHCRAGEWIPQIPTCVEDPCNMNDLPSDDWNIMYDYPGGTDESAEVMKPPGTVARLTCKEIGYVAAGQNTRTCRQGEWDGQNPSCKRSRCQTSRLEDGRLRYYDSGGTRTLIPRHGDYRRATCKKGYSLEGTSRTQCLEGEWTEGLPTCQEIHCSVETIDNGVVTRGNGDPFTQEASHGDMIRFTCEQGYTLAGEEISHCRAGEWNPDIPTCVEDPCNMNDLPSGDWNIMYDYPGGRDESAEVMKPPGTVARLTCKEIGYVTVGQNTRTCRQGGWDGQNPSCKRSRCQTSRLENGKLRYYDRDGTLTSIPRHGDYRIATCKYGYSLEGTQRTECLEGEWIEGLPTCQEIPCDHEPLENGVVTYTIDGVDSQEPVHGVMRSYNCDSGYTVDDDEPSQCDGGSWTRALPVCNENPCSINDLATEDWDILYNHPERRDELSEVMKPPGTVARFTCNISGYVTVGRDTRTCRQGEWDGQNPPCVRSTCPSIHVENGILEYRSINNRVTSDPRHGDFMRVTCNRGYFLQGPIQRQCWDGQWENGEPSCLESTCGSIQLDNGRYEYRDSDNIVILDPRHGDFGSATCNRGYYLVGASETQCWDGQWEDELPTCLEEPCNKNDLPTGDWEIEFKYPGGRDESAEVMKSPGTVARFRCNVAGYAIDGDDTRLCTLGQWDGPLMSCERSRCQTSQLEDGRLRYYDSDDARTLIPRHGDYRIATCNDGYSLDGTSRTQCLEGEWMNELPTCQENPCSFLNETEVPDYLQVTYTDRARGGRTISTSEGSVPSRGVATFTCREEGFVLSGESQRTCKKGTWRGEFPECVIAHCGVETIHNGGVTKGNGDPFTQEAIHGDWIHFTCEQGYTLAGEEISHCRAGEWIPEIPTCVEASCSAVANNGKYENMYYQGRRNPPDTSFPAYTQLEVECTEGRVPEGPRMSECRRGLWEPSPPLCVQAVSNEQEQRCSNPDVSYSVETFVGSDYTPLTKQEIFREGDFTTSRCQDPKRQRYRGSVTRFCEGGEWSGHPAECESTDFEFYVGNTVVQTVTEDGTIIVYPVSGYVTINCALNGLQGTVIMYYQGTSSVRIGAGFNRYSHRIYNPSQSNSGTYRCESNGRSHSITVLFEAIYCPPPSQPSNWDHNRTPANRDGRLGYIFTETLSLRCQRGYTSSNPILPNRCTHHGTWSNMSQRCIRY